MWKISLLLSTFALSGGVAAASFDCQKAKTELEHFLCDHTELSQLDSRLGEYYRKLTSTLSPAELKQLRATQTAWLDKRTMDCAATNATCLKELYQKRIVTLAFRASPEFKTSAAGKVAGNYSYGKNMELLVEALDANTIAVAMSGAGEGGRWTCDFSAEGELKNGSAKLHVLDDAVVSFRFEKNKVVVSESGGHSSYCGMGGELQGTYTRVSN
ncbi:MAG: lysozyme inhibitor LprI family protein [Thiotrichaceae bacterium]|nr:lysozyme inhibitor LprI family protein [Thiotrichaceae bacterium]